jgi:hypothetical protein
MGWEIQGALGLGPPIHNPPWWLVGFSWPPQTLSYVASILCSSCLCLWCAGTTGVHTMPGFVLLSSFTKLVSPSSPSLTPFQLMPHYHSFNKP